MVDCHGALTLCVSIGTVRYPSSRFRVGVVFLFSVDEIRRLVEVIRDIERLGPRSEIEAEIIHQLPQGLRYHKGHWGTGVNHPVMSTANSQLAQAFK